MKSRVDTIVELAVALVLVTAGAIPCVLVFLRPRWFRVVLGVGVALAALFAMGTGLMENNADMDDHEWVLLSVLIAGMLLFVWCLGALWGHLFDRWRKHLRSLRSQDDAQEPTPRSPRPG